MTMDAYMRERPRHLHAKEMPCPDPQACAVRHHPLLCDLADDAQRWLTADEHLGWSRRTSFEPSVGAVCNSCGEVLTPLASRLEVTPEEVEAKRAELAAAGRPSGYKHIARELMVSESTVRRRLGRLK